METPLSALRAKRAGAKYSLRIYIEAKLARVPFSWALALVEQESEFQNVFGNDHGTLRNKYRAPFCCGVQVTQSRVQELKKWVSYGNASNGVGLTQLTSIGLIRQAELLGGAHIEKNQLKVGLRYLRSVSGGDYDHDAWKYNGRPSYQSEIKAKQRKWHKIVT